jgi:hypothetical protein
MTWTETLALVDAGLMAVLIMGIIFGLNRMMP